MKFIGILMGSKSDSEVVQECTRVLDNFEVPYEILVASAHRSPKRVREYVREAEQKGAQVFIAAAGMAAHLAGAVSALSLKPVIGIPLNGGILDGLDALLSTVQMPGGMPVAAMAVGKAGAINAAHLAMQILALENKELEGKLHEYRKNALGKIQADSKDLEKIL